MPPIGGQMEKSPGVKSTYEVSMGEHPSDCSHTQQTDIIIFRWADPTLSLDVAHVPKLAVWPKKE